MSKCPACSGESRVYLQGLYDDRFAYPEQFDLLECVECKHKFLDGSFTDEMLQKLYTDYYPRSDIKIEDFRPLTYEKGFKSWLKGEKRAYSLVPENVRILDIGCGFGETLAYHKNRNCDVYGCEADQNVKKVADEFGYNIHLGLFDPNQYQEKFFDYITMDQVLEHSTDPKKILSDIRTVLKDDGKLIITIPNANGWGAKKFGRKWLHWHTPYHLQFFSKKSLQLTAEEANFKLESFETLTHSEWLFWQRIHLACFPEFKEPSPFFSSKTKEPMPQQASQKIEKLHKEHKYLTNHIATRFFDALGVGDNILAVLKAQ